MGQSDTFTDAFGDAFDGAKASRALSLVFDGLGFQNTGLLIVPVDLQYLKAEEGHVAVYNGRSNANPVDKYINSSLGSIVQVVSNQRASKFPHCWSSAEKKWVRLDPAALSEGNQPLTIGMFSMHSSGEMIGIVVETTSAKALANLPAFHHHALMVIDKIIDLRAVKTSSILTTSETNVLSWCANGKTSFEISKILELSEHTVNHYLASTCRKLEANNRAQAASKAIKLGILSIESIH